MESKKIIIPLVAAVIIIAAIIVAMSVSDGGKEPSVSTETVTVNAYDMSYLIYDEKDPRSQEPPKDISEYLTGEFGLLIKKDQGEVLYATVDTLADMIAGDLKEGFSLTCDRSGKAFTMSFINEEGKQVCQLVFDASNMSITETGSLDDIFTTSDPKDTTMEQTKLDMKDIVNPGSPFVFSFAGYGLDAIEKDGLIYFPLDLMSLELQRASLARAFVYSADDNMLFQYSASEQLDVKFINGSDPDATMMKIVSSSYSKYKNDKGVINPPAYMLEHVRNMFYFLMDNYYGLNSVTGFRSMSDFVKNNGYSEQLVSPDPEERTVAYKIIIAQLADLHTSYGGSKLLGENGSINVSDHLQYMLYDRSMLRNMLSAERAEVLKAEGVDDATEVRYSSDGRTAYFSFDNFQNAKYYHETLTPEERLADTYYLFVDRLNQIKDHGGVERVVLDDTVNGGGIVIIMGKLLALMSDDNYARINFAYENSGTVTDLEFRVDSNGDGVYDENDCFGQYFDFYILTSSFSFSCGNAFPFHAKCNGIAQVMGVKSGGGEMTVDGMLFPFGVSMKNSSLRHMSYYDHETQTWKGDEAGQPVDIRVLTGWYDVDAISEAIDSHNASS